MYKKIIVFEGIDGSGKTYHLNEVSRYLRKKKIDFLKIREPGGSRNSEIIRRLILNNKSTLKKKTDFFLYLAARNENFEVLIKPHINKKIILIDRFKDSTMAYQHYGFNISKDIIQKSNKFILGNLKVDFTFLHIVAEKNIKKKISGKKNRYDLFKRDFYRKVQRGFLKISKKNKKKLIVDSHKSKEYNKKIIKNQINKILKIND